MAIQTVRGFARRAFRMAPVVLMCIFCVPSAVADIHVAALPEWQEIAPGQPFAIEFSLTEAGAPFNGYDSVLQWDPVYMTYLGMERGALMMGVCGNTFADSTLSLDGSTFTLAHVLLCAGQSISDPGPSPGVLHRVYFLAGPSIRTEFVRLVAGTRFFLAGLEVTPLFTEDAIVQIGIGTDVPSQDRLSTLNLQAAPNPFNPQTEISFTVPESGPASLTVYAANGRRVRSLLLEHLSPGPYSVPWDGRDDTGRITSSGAYQVLLEFGGQKTRLPVTLIK